MNVAIIGGNFGYNPKSSSVVNKINDIFEYRDLRNMSIDNVTCINGGDANDNIRNNIGLDIKLFEANIVASQDDLVIWMPNISNDEEKVYPQKKQGAILICSKVMRDGYKRIDAISRIFKMHGNAVIAIYKETDKFRFELIDALGNIWYNGSDIYGLCCAIEEFVNFTQSAKRVTTKQRDACSMNLNELYKDNLQALIDCNKKLQEHVAVSCGNRFFGNISTRCSKLFPTMRPPVIDDMMFVSPRNVDKSSITTDMMVPYFIDDTYIGERKPSVDSPTQIRLYKQLANINYMIHGHAVITGEGVLTTDEYRLCGDINEVDEVLNVLEDHNTNSFIINLKNHGFLIGADTIQGLDNLIKHISNKCNVKITNQ